MNALLKVPRALARLQYEALRVPLSTLAAPAMARLYAHDAAPRLGFDKALGHLDALAGRLLGEPILLGRGEAKLRRAEALERANTLEYTAAASRAKAAQVRQQAVRVAQERRQAAQEQAVAAAEAVRVAHRAADAAARKKSAAKAQAATAAAERATTMKLQAEARKLDHDLSTVQKSGARRAGVPKARLDGARAVAADAVAQKRNADRLARLAEAEKKRRTTG